MRILLLATLIASGPRAFASDFQPTQAPGGDAVNITVIPKRDCKANVIGLQIVEVAVSGEVGGTAMSRLQYYRSDERAITEDEDVIAVKGFASRDVIEIEDRRESRHWLIDHVAGKPFDEAARKLAENPESKELVLDLYKRFRSPPFSQVATPDRKSVASARWLAGKQRCDGVEFGLAPSSDYGNVFTATVETVAARALVGDRQEVNRSR